MEPSKPKYVCLVTVHGIGFQQAPEGTTPGYADELHKHLRKALPNELGEDRDPGGRGCGAVYVQSEFDHSRTKGLARLDEHTTLVEGGPIAHIALVYSRTEDVGPQLSATLSTLTRAAFTIWRYKGPVGLAAILWRTISGVLRQRSADPEAISNLTPRYDVAGGVRRTRLRRYAEGAKRPFKPTIIRALEDDVATYVYRNDLRERVRGFVQEALQKLLERDDVEAIVVNAHSQGTVLCWDVLCRLPLVDHKLDWAKRIRAFVTAGSPIRKYVRVFSWGERVGQMVALPHDRFDWENYWDPCDPVADELAPTPLVEVNRGTGAVSRFAIGDQPVNNVKNSSGGGLQAHDYWNNESEFVKPLADRLRALAKQLPTATPST